MIYSTATVTVNPRGERKLTREQVWAGLMLKARDARLFLPPGLCTKCEVVAEGQDFIVREAVIMNDELTEIVTFVPWNDLREEMLQTTPMKRDTVRQILLLGPKCVGRYRTGTHDSQRSNDRCRKKSGVFCRAILCAGRINPPSLKDRPIRSSKICVSVVNATEPSASLMKRSRSRIRFVMVSGAGGV